jgi:WD40 repeat protein
VSTAERGWKWLRRRPALAFASLFGCIAVVALTALVLSSLLAPPPSSAVAEASFDRAQDLLGQGDVPLGLHQLVRSLERTPKEDAALRRVIRTNLEGWSRHLCALQDVYPQAGLVLSLATCPDQRAYLIGLSSPDADSGEALFLEAGTGKQVGPALAHGSPIWAVSLSPDGKTVASGAEDGTARLWRAETGQQVGAPMPHEARVVAVAFHPDGKTVVTASKDGWVRRWDAATAAPLCGGFQVPGLAGDRNGTAEVSAAALSPDGETLATGCFELDPGGERKSRVGPGFGT